MPTNFAVFDILPPNFFNCVVKYSFSKFSLASRNGIDKFSVIEKLSSIDFDNDSLIISSILFLSPFESNIAILSIKFRNSLTLPGQL